MLDLNIEQIERGDYIELLPMNDYNYKIIDAYRIKGLLIQVLRFTVPLNYAEPNSSPKITVVARLVTQQPQGKVPSSKLNWTLALPESGSNICVYLQGGPGFPCSPPDYSGITKVMIDKGFQMLYLDQRGTGLSTQLDSARLMEFDSDFTRLKYLRFFRALDIVNDAETIREALIGKDKWSLLGQSYGGFCATTYLSYYPQKLNQVLIAGGIPPINGGPDDVYNATYLRTEERNEAYYQKYPEDIHRVHTVCAYLHLNDVKLPNGGNLTVERLQATGISFGGTSGTDALHQMVLNLYNDLENFGRFTFGTLAATESALKFDSNIIYFLFQEAIYLDTGKSSRWSADRLRYKSKINYDYPTLLKQISSTKTGKNSLENAVYFTGEMVYKSMLDDFVELRPLKGLAHELHKNADWGDKPLYKPLVLLQNTVPVAAASYFHDQYVDFGLTMKLKQHIKGIKQYITNEYFHNGLRDDPEKVLNTLLKLLENGDVI